MDYQRMQRVMNIFFNLFNLKILFVSILSANLTPEIKDQKLTFLKMTKITLKQSAIMMIALVIFGFSCGGGKDTIQKGKILEESLAYGEAAKVYKNVYTKSKTKPERAEAAYRAAEAYYKADNFKDAEKWFRTAIKQEHKDPLIGYYIGRIEMLNEHYEQAIVEFNNYKKSNPDDSLADVMIAGSEQALKWKKDKPKYRIENCKVINTRYFDYAPAYYKKDQVLFTTDRPGGNGTKKYPWTSGGFSDLYSTTINLKTAQMKPPVILKGKINSPYNDGSCQADKKGKVYLTICNGRDGKEKRCKIYSCEDNGKEYAAPELLNFNNDSLYQCTDPSISPDGETLYFVSEMDGGIGGLDIWFARYNKKTKDWGEPVNCGPTINTIKDEVYPWVHDDGSLFFASNGHPGMGGMDIFYSAGVGKEWTKPKNMKWPINTGGDDFALICDKTKETGYFTSNRPGGKGGDDIYRFYLLPMEICLVGKVTGCVDHQPIPNATVTINNSINNEVLTIKTDAKGEYKTKCNLKPNAEYSLYAQKREDLYIDSKVEEVSTMGIEVSTTLRQDFCLDELPVDKYFNVPGIYYDLDSARIRPDAALILDSLIGILNKYPKITIELGSHTDCRATYDYNINLSQRRADSAVDYLIRNGIEKERLVAKGYGETYLVNDCACEKEKGMEPSIKCTDTEHQANRRTTVKVTGKAFISKLPPKKPAKEAPKGKTPKARK